MHVGTTHSKKDEIKSSEVHVTVDVEESSLENVPLNAPKSVVCPFCELPSKTITELKKHLEIVHGVTEKILNSREDLQSLGNETCTECSECTFIGSKAELSKHSKSKHGNSLICDKCESKFPDEKTMNDHKNAIHGSSEQHEPFPCEW